MAVLPGNQEREERLETQPISLTTIKYCRDNSCTCDTVKDFPASLVSSSYSSSSSSSSSEGEDVNLLHYYTKSEIRYHNTEASAWIVAGDNIYDVTDYIEIHPGGKYSIMKKIGGIVDCSQDLMFHSKSGQNHWKRYLIGKITKIPSNNGQPVMKEWWKFWE